MRINSGCDECIAKFLLKVAEDASDSAARKEELHRELKALHQSYFGKKCPPQLAGAIGDLFQRERGELDPFAEVKDRSTELGLELLPELREIVSGTEDPFAAAVRLAIAGNIIDYGATPDFDLAQARDGIMEALRLPVDANAITLLKSRMDQAEKILYVLDNCGEAVLDRLLMEPYREKLLIGVRGRCAQNDVTRREARLSGLDFAPIVDTGDNSPGVVQERTSELFLRAMEEADLVIAKGQGNFESLEDNVTRPTFFLFRAKCPVIMRYIGAEKNSIQIRTRNV